ncbi:MAG TPA: hypothetical protein VKV38_15990 [Trebonia sp.]|nr:hypothetical protein [Trebonia sp.]
MGRVTAREPARGHGIQHLRSWRAVDETASIEVPGKVKLRLTSAR